MSGAEVTSVRAGQGQDFRGLRRKDWQQRCQGRAEMGLARKGRLMGRSLSLHLSNGEAVATQKVRGHQELQKSRPRRPRRQPSSASAELCPVYNQDVPGILDVPPMDGGLRRLVGNGAR